MTTGRRGKISKRMSLQRKRKITFLFFFVLICSVFIFGASYFALKKYVNKVDGKVICDNIYIGNVNVSGMTSEKAKQAVEDQLTKQKGCIITMKTENGEEKAVLEEFGLSVENVDSLIKKAVNYGKSGSVWKRYHQMKKVEQEKLIIDETFTLNSETAAAVLNERTAPLLKGAVDATIKKSGDKFELTQEQEGKALDVDASLKKIINYLNESWDDKNFSIDMETKKDKPKVTEKDLSAIKDELGSFSTDAGGGGRWQNLERGMELLNGHVLMPGEELSVYACTGPYDAENGYVLGGAFENGKVVEAYGGGICQVSTTLYNAAIFAELEIVERYPHSMLVGYVEPSMDAAIAGDYLDLVFKNPYDTPVYIYGEIDDANQMRFTVYGKETRAAGRSIAFESETLSTKEYGTTYKENAEAAIGSMENTGNPQAGKEARLWKIVYENGKELSRDIFNTSVYEKADQIVEVGTASSNAEASALVRSAIETQNESAVEEAVAKASVMAGTQE